MRRANGGGWLIDEKNIFMGVNLGADFCAEHEWGVAELMSLLGVPKEPVKGVYGMERRRCPVPKKDCVFFKEENDTYNLIVMPEWRMKYFKNLDELEKFHPNETMVTAWNDGSFMVRVKGEENAKKLKIIHENLVAGKCAIWLGGGWLAFKNAGLCIGVIDLIPEECLKVMRDADVDREKLQLAAEATGIRQEIESKDEDYRNMEEVETGRRSYTKRWGFFALSPRWANKDEKKKTKHPVVFWLNPLNQEDNNYGWFTVEELKKWLENKGPIPKGK